MANVLLGAVLAVAAADALAEGWNLGGHAKYQYTRTDYRPDDLAAVVGDDPADDRQLDLRLKAEWRAAGWELVGHYEVLGVAGDGLAARRRLAALGFGGFETVTGLPDDRRRLFDLTDTLTDQERRAAVQRLDRLSVGYLAPGWTVRLGRQALSWGNGLAFHPLDFVNPFSPIAIDKGYKTGEDMAYGQWAVGEGMDVQAIAVARRDPVSGDVEDAEATGAVKYRLRSGAFELDLIAARHYDESVAGLGVVRSIGGAVWRLDLSRTATDGDGGVVSLATNVDYSWTWGGRNYYGYAEYFRNGFGIADPVGYANPDPALAARLARGELHTLARDYLALAGQVELTPLVNVYLTVVHNLNDASDWWQLRAVYDWLQDVQLQAGANLPVGARGDEYGGIPTPGGGYVAAGRSLYARIAYYL
jgi:hypothetical protein